MPKEKYGRGTLCVEDTQLYQTAPTSASVHVRLLCQHNTPCPGNHIQIPKQVRNKMGRVTDQLLQLCTRGGDRSMWLAAGTSTVSMARANPLGRTCLWTESLGSTEAAGRRKRCWHEVSLRQVAP